MTVEEFERHGRTTPAELAKRIPGLRGYRLNFVREKFGDSGGCDGISEAWFDDAASMAA